MSPAEVQVDSPPSSLPCWDAFGVLAGDYEWFVRDTRRGLRCRRALSRRIKLFHFGDQPRDGSRDIDRFLLIRQCGPCAGATGCGVHYPGLTERPAERLCLCNVDSRVSQLKYLQLCMRNFLECLTSSGIFLIGTIASTNSRDQPSAQVQ